jgi:hypothetical protein
MLKEDELLIAAPTICPLSLISCASISTYLSLIKEFKLINPSF